MNNIDFEINDNGNVIFSADNNESSIDIQAGETNNNIDLNVGNNVPNVSMEVMNPSQNINFEIGEASSTYNDYERLLNKPSINSVILIDNKTSQDLGLQPAGNYANSKISNIEIDALFR